MPLRKLWPFRKKKKTPVSAAVEYSVPQRVYTPVNLVEIGMYVIELDRSWLDSPFLFQGFEVQTQDEILQLRGCCDYVYIDTTIKRKRRFGKFATHNKPLIETASDYGTPPPKLGSFETEIGRAEVVYRQVSQFVAETMQRVSYGEAIDTKLAKAAVAECVASILHSPDAFLWLIQLKNRDEYTAQHSLNVCVLSIVLGRHINLSDTSLHNVGLCGLMHDMGKMLVPDQILNKPGRLEPDEMEIMRGHTTKGYELLQSSENMYPGAIKTALSHHEMLNGKGYPNQLTHRHIPLFTRIVTIADIYDAMTSDRVYQKGRTHLEATSIMADMSGESLEERLVTKFIESLGVYPPGCVVMLTNGAIAIVVEVNEFVRLRPKIIILLDAEKQPLAEEVTNLADMPLDDRGNLLTIRGIVRAQDYAIDIGKFYREGVLQKGFAANQ
ncbi:HD-GYP domain-containing protein [Methylomonas sp. LL1]|uniref:HD-GYP domain-containing protein n=1 Tax=Methylomonas sp. LL1 TaxID=2785785 RepID=UPI0018C3EC29|nr:HD-GYP domain-containing protein [Methylomonas sp. LL1]QPK61985.1 HD-GYP domain-containing protein [Methylomonas sp. LL1]CAG1022751.1 Cyclic di-GMP phosphodiesterase [Methylococcales bacterium]